MTDGIGREEGPQETGHRLKVARVARQVLDASGTDDIDDSMQAFKGVNQRLQTDTIRGRARNRPEIVRIDDVDVEVDVHALGVGALQQIGEGAR